MPRILDGRALAAARGEALRPRIALLRARLGRPPGLGVLLVGDDPAAQIYVRNKARAAAALGMASRLVRLPATAPAAVVLAAVEALNRAIVDGELPHDGDPRLARHVKNARRRPNRYGVSFGKESRESPHKVDALAALVLARMARQRVLAENVLSKRRGRVGRLVGF